MKKSYLILILLLLSIGVTAQQATLKKANKLFAKKSYIEASKLYKSLELNQEVLQKLGDCYYYNFNMANASKTYEQLFNEFKDSISKDYFFKYAHALYGNKKLRLADQTMSDYLDQSINTPKFKNTLKHAVPFTYEIKKVTKGASKGDFGLSYNGDKVVFASFRNSNNRTYNWNNRPYLDLFEATVSEEGYLENIQAFSDEINSKTHESNATFTKDGKTMYFSRTNDKRHEIGDEKFASVKLYKAQYIDSIWTNVEELPFSSDLYSTQHPVLDKDNKKLYFSSNMPGSLGSFDIYYVDINGSNYGQPVNLGENINTVHREQFPFIDENDVLYFASDGHKGLGNLDLFQSIFKNNSYTTPLNLGATINSGMDDFGLVLKPKSDKGFLASNREGSDNLYGFIRQENDQRYIVEGTVRDKHSKELLPNTTVTLFDESGTKVGEIVVGEDGRYEFMSKPNHKYKIEGYRPFYVPTIESFSTDDTGKIEYNIELEIESYDDAEEIVVTKEDGYIYIELENIYFDLDKWDIKPQAARTLDVLVALLKKHPRMEVQLGAHTDSRSTPEYNLTLSENRAKSTLEYIVSNGIERARLRSKGYGESEPLVKCGDDCTEDEHSINRRCEFIIIK